MMVQGKMNQKMEKQTKIKYWKSNIGIKPYSQIKKNML